MQAVFADVPVVRLDATERPYQRAQAAADRPADYSGKKKATPKNTLLADLARYLHYLGLPANRTTHADQMLNQASDVNLGLLDLFLVLAALGYRGLVAGYEVAPRACPTASPGAAKSIRSRP